MERFADLIVDGDMILLDDSRPGMVVTASQDVVAQQIQAWANSSSVTPAWAEILGRWEREGRLNES